MYILGINCYHNFAAAALLDSESIVAFVEEERLSRVKYDGRFPENAIRYCLGEAGIDIDDVAHVGFYYNPYLGLGFRIRELLRGFPRSLTAIGEDYASEWWRIARVGSEIRRRFPGRRGRPKFKLHWIDHYTAHAASCYSVSDFEHAAILCIDGNGERATTWFGEGSSGIIRPVFEVRFPHSVGLLYAAFTEYLGFRNNADEGKVMGLAPYGEPSYIDFFREISPEAADGTFRLDMSYFSFHVDVDSWFTEKLTRRLGPPRTPDEEITDRHRDIAASLQLRTEELGLRVARSLYRRVPSPNLAMAGGVALNSVMNGRIQRETPFERLFVQPAANDAGTALGAALAVHDQVLRLPRTHRFETVYLGPGAGQGEVERAARAHGLRERRVPDAIGETARLLAEGRIVGWFQGRMEVGPRALGNRSILADPRRAEMKDLLNSKIKHRESFRPFAPVVLAECASDYFVDCVDSPYMLIVAPVRPERRQEIPAVTHVDGTGRVQTVTARQNPNYYALLRAFHRITGVPVLLNTSFNQRGQPIVHDPEEAVVTFLRSGMDHLYMEGRLFDRPESHP